MPTWGVAKYGLELKGLRTTAETLASVLNDVAVAIEDEEVAFVIVPHVFTQCADVTQALAIGSKSPIRARIVFPINHELLSIVRLADWDTTKAGLILNLEDQTTPLSALMSESIEAIRLDQGFADRLSGSLKGALMLQMLRDLAHESGLASLGPVFQTTNGSPGLPIRFDYVVENPIQ
ncbi:MAG: hypothetical protein ABI330_01890 [Caldimonas sp.]